MRVDYAQGRARRSERHEPLEEGDCRSRSTAVTRQGRSSGVRCRPCTRRADAATFRTTLHEVGRQDPHARRPRQRRHAERRARRRAHFGAEGIGLCRTEHMFFDGDGSSRVREMILARQRGRAPHALRRSCRSEGGLRRASSASMDGCRSRSACSIRRCTSSCRRDDADIAVVARDWASTSRRLERARRTSSTSPTRCSATAAAASAITYPGDLRDAGARDLPGRVRACEEGRHRRRSPRS